MRSERLNKRLFPWLIGLVLMVLVSFAPVVQAACPETRNVSSPIIYRDCVELINLNPGDPANNSINTSSSTQIDDYHVLVVVRGSDNNSAAIATPSGWTPIMASTRNGSNGSNDVVMGIYAKRATAAGAESVSIATSGTGNASNDLLVWIMRFSNTSGHDTAMAANATNTPGQNTTVTSPGITTSFNDSLVIRIAGIDDDDQTAAQDTAGIFNGTTISLQETAASDRSVTGIATYLLKAAAGAVPSRTFNNTGNEQWITRTFALMPKLPYFTIAHAGSGQTCGYHVVTITARNAAGALNSAYTGTINLSTSTGSGYWLTAGGDANGTLTGGGVGNGTAAYTFVGGDAGSVQLVYFNDAASSVNFNILSGAGYKESTTPSEDPSLTLTACTSGVGMAQQTCNVFPGSGGNVSFSHVGTGTGLPSSATEKRMVVVMWGGENGATPDLSAASATFNGAPMQSITFRHQNDSVDNYSQIFALNHAGLPASAGNYTVQITGAANDVAACAFTLTGVNQVYPAGDGTGLPVNNNGVTGNQNVITTQITTEANNSLVLASVSNGNNNSYTHSLLTERYDAAIGGGGATFSVSAQQVRTAGLLSVTDTASGANRQTQAVAAFRPFIPEYFTISHDTTGQTCELHTITISARNANGTVNTGYLGTISLSTSVVAGIWSTEGGDANGTLSGGSAGDGTASYTFVAGDAGSIDLQFYNADVSTVNFNIVDGGGVRESTIPSEDPSLSITTCLGDNVSAAGQTCSVFANNGGTISFSHTGENGASAPPGLLSNATDDRMVVVVYGGENPGSPDLGAATATFNGVPMQSITFRRQDDGADNYTQIFALNHAALPTAAGDYTVEISGTADDAAACAFTLQDVDQTYPIGDGSGLPVNNNSTTGNENVITTQVTTEIANSYVIAGVSNGGSGSYTHSLSNELYDTSVGGGGAVFSVSAQTITAAGLLNVTDTATGANRQTQVVAAFKPTVQNGYFYISHAGSGYVCAQNAITIRATDFAGNTDTAYLGAVTVSASGTGNWSVGPGATGTFSNGTANNGIATYTFAAGDNGQVVLNFKPANSTTVNFNVVDSGDAAREVFVGSDPDLILQNCEIRIDHDEGGNTCSAESITFSVVTAGGVAVNNFAGTLSISTVTTPSGLSDKGSWALGAGETGTLTETTPKDGIASYTFPAVNDGSITFNFTETVVGTVNFNATATGGLAVNSSYDDNLIVANCAFRLSFTDNNITDVCSMKELTITAVDDAGATLTNFTGQVNITTTSGKGTWAKSGSQPGTFTDLLANDGSASYTFVSADGGDVALMLQVPETGIGSLKVDVETVGGGMQVDASYDPTLTIELCSFRIVMDDEFATSCSAEPVTITAYNRNDTVATNYTGTIELTTLHDNGSWFLTTGNGSFQDPVGEDGEATYTFSASDNGQVVLGFLDDISEDTNIGVVDTLESGFSEDGDYDPTLEVISCIPFVFDSQCYNGQSQADAIDIPAQSSQGESRTVLLFTFSEADVAASNARLSLGATNYSMTHLYTANNTDVRSEVWAILGDDLPDTSESLDAAFDGGPWTASFGTRNPGFCLVSVENVEQVLPSLASPPENGQLNGFAGDGVTSNTLQVYNPKNNSMVLSSFGTGTNSGTTLSSSLDTVLWDIDSSQGNSPDSANFNASYEIIPVASFTNINIDTDSVTADRFAQLAVVLAPLVEGTPYAEDYVPVTLFETFAGNLSYRATGRSFRTLPNPPSYPYTNACTMASSSASTIGLPPGSSIVKAYLWWVSSGRTADVDTVVSFGPTGSQVPTTTTDTFQILGVGSGENLDYYLNYKDVTPLITTNTTQEYTVSDFDIENGSPWVDTSACVGGWAMVVVFENVTWEPFVSVVNLFHGFQPFQDSNFTLVPRNFRMAEPDVLNNIPRGLISHFTFEGDDNLNGGDEVFGLQNNPATLTFENMTNPFNLGTAQYNDTVTIPDYYSSTSPKPYIAQSTTSYGTDVDTYYISGAVASAAEGKEDILYLFGDQRAEQITTRYSSGQDLVLLGGEFIVVTNAPIADLEMNVTNSGGFQVSSTGTGSIYLDVVNNGNSSASNGYATGTVIISGIMPPGLEVNSITADAHWVCTNTAANFRCTFDIDTWTGGTYNSAGMNYQLDDGNSLPQVAVLVDVLDGPTYFPLAVNNAYFTGRVAHFNTPDNCDYTGIPDGEQPDPYTCTKAKEFDNVNDLNKNTIDVDDIVEKQVNNNNVDRTQIEIGGIVTDLAIDVSVVGVLQQGEAAQYQFKISNIGPDDTTAPITVTAAFDAGAAPTAGSFTSNGWSCTIVTNNMTCTSAASLSASANSIFTVDIPSVTEAEGQFVSLSGAVAAGTYNFDPVNGNNADTLNTEVVGLIVPITERFLMSVSESTTLGSNSVSFGPEDLVLFDPDTNQAEMYFDSSTVGGVNDIDAVHLLPNGQIVFSVNGSGTFDGVDYDDEDLLIWDPIREQASMLFDGSDANKFDTGAGAANIDAVYIDTNDSYTTTDWDIYLSTSGPASLPGAASFEDRDMVLYDMSTNTASVFLDGSDADVFDSSAGDIDGFYIPYDDEDLYYLTVSDALSTIDSDESFERDDLLKYDDSQAAGMKATQAFDGEQTDGFTPASASLSIDSLHIVQDGYFGHFSINATDGEVCTPGLVTIRKHVGLTHTVDTSYVGSIRITESSGTATWSLDGSANGTLTTLSSSVIYTFHPDDEGEVVLLFSQPGETANTNINVSNGIAKESAVEDQQIDISASIVAVNYKDQFSSVTYLSNNGNAAFNGGWIEVNGDGSASYTATANMYVNSSSKRLVMRDPNAVHPYIYRAINFDYDADTGTDPLTLAFNWSRSGGTTSDVFVVEYSQNEGSSWSSPVGTYGNATTGAKNQTTASINLTAAGVSATDGDSLWIRFRISSGMQLDTMTIDNVDISTSSDSDCSPGLDIDHYHISNSGSLVSCLATNVTFTAHDSSHNAIAAGAGVVLNISTSTGKGSWNTPLNPGPFSSSAVSDNGVATYTFQAAENSVVIPFNYTNPATDTVTVGFNVQDSNLISDLEEADMTVTRAGLRFYNATNNNEAWPTLVAGMDSLAYTGQTLIVQAIKASDDDPRACEPMFASPAVVPIELVLECQNPSTCSASNVEATLGNIAGPNNLVNTVNDNGAEGIASGDLAEYRQFNIAFSNFTDSTFGAYSAGTLQLTYPDVGQLQMHGRYNIRFNNDLDGTLSGNYATGSSTAFIVRPFALDVDFADANGDWDRANYQATVVNDPMDNTTDDPLESYASDHDGPAFAKAGLPVNARVRAVLWSAADDALNNSTGLAGSDGIPDFRADLSNNVAAPNFGRESNFNTTYRVSLNVVAAHPVTAAPLPGVPGGVTSTLDQTGTFSSYTAGVSNDSSTVIFNNVGIYDVRAVLTDAVDAATTYLGSEAVIGWAARVGRIYPVDYEFNMATTMLTERPDVDGDGDFTYMGEEFEVQLSMMARHANGTTLSNYFGDFAKLNDVSEFTFSAFEDNGSVGSPEADVDWTSRLGNFTDLTFVSAWNEGLGTVTGRLIFKRASDGVPDGPLLVDIAVDLEDDDGVLEVPDRIIDSGVETDPDNLRFIEDMDFRYGRLVLLNAYGSEIPDLDGNNIGLDVGMGIKVEYWDADENAFVLNEDDSGSFFDIQHLGVVSGTGEGSLEAGDVSPTATSSVNGGVTTVYDGTTAELNETDLPFYFTAPGDGKDGSIVLEYDLSNATGAGLEYLWYDWRTSGQIEDDLGDNIYTDNPRSMLEFGIFQTSNRIINWQELFIDAPE